HARPEPRLPRRHPHPRLLSRQEHRPPADDEVPHLHDDDGRDEERVRRSLEHAAALHALVDPRDARRSPRDPEGDPLGPLRDHGRHHRRQRAGAADDVSGREERDAGVGGSGRDRRRVSQDDGVRSDVARLHPPRARGRTRRRRPARHRDRRRRRRREGELALPRRQEPGARRRRRSDLVRTAEALSEAVLPHAARQRLHPRERRLPRLLSLAAHRSPRVRALVRDDRVGAALPALRADGAAGRADHRSWARARRRPLLTHSLISPNPSSVSDAGSGVGVTSAGATNVGNATSSIAVQTDVALIENGRRLREQRDDACLGASSPRLREAAAERKKSSRPQIFARRLTPMNCTRLALAAVAGTVFDACYGVTVYGMLLAPEFAKYPGVYRAADVGPSYLPLMFAGILLAVAVVTVIYAKGYEGRGAGEGVRFGALVAAFGTCAFSGVNYA